MLLILAWRNLWRNRWRTFLSVAAIFLGVLFLSLSLDIYDFMLFKSVDESVKTSVGDARVARKGYFDSYILSLTLDSLPHDIRNDPHVEAYTPRMRFFALLTSEGENSGVQILGILPAGERRVTSLISKLSVGKVENGGLVLGHALSRLLNVGLGDTVYVVATDVMGFPIMKPLSVSGMFTGGSPREELNTAITTIGTVKRLLRLRGKAHEYVLKLRDPMKAIQWKEKLNLTKGEYDVVVWQEEMRGVWEIIRMWEAFKIIMAAILYPAVFLIVFNTFTMAYYERRREFAVLLALGIGRLRLFFLLMGEILLLGLFSSTFSILSSLLLAFILKLHPLNLSPFINAIRWEGMYILPVISVAFNPENYVLSVILMLFVILVIGLVVSSSVFRINVGKYLREGMV